jgi:hypothetical protein
MNQIPAPTYTHATTKHDHRMPTISSAIYAIRAHTASHKMIISPFYTNARIGQYVNPK